MSSSSVNRCIAIAAHGRRCQQSTYRGSPYCWHHTQSRKVWAPSRVAPRPRSAETPVFALATPETRPPVPAIDRIAHHLNRGQLEQLARFLESPGDGTFAITRAHGYVEVRGWARPSASPSHAHSGN
jgi:hypothetical protein